MAESTRDEPSLLDRFETPDGEVELVAYRERDTAWVGVRSNGRLRGAIGLRTGSGDHDVEATAEIHDGWALAYGALSLRLVRAEIETDDGDMFPARIVPLPADFDDDYSAVWGLAERCRRECSIVGYDVRGRAFEGMHPLVTGPEPSIEDRVAAIRAHVHGSMRYLATATTRERDIATRDWLRSQLSTLANVLALLDGPSLDDRSMLARRDRSVREYLADAERDPHRPGVCSFCGERPIVAYFEGPSFGNHVERPEDVRATSAHPACETCFALVEADDRDELARRGAARLARDPDARRIARTREQQDEDFWSKHDAG